MKKDIERIKKLLNSLNSGGFRDEEGIILYNLARNCKGKGVIVEIGSWKGRSTIWLANGSKQGNSVKVYAIDPHTGLGDIQKKYGPVWTFDEFKKNIKKAGVDDIVIPIVKTSKEAAKDFKKPVEFIFIDGGHEYEVVKSDFFLWFPKLVNGGIMAFHDSTTWEGPKKIVDNYIFKSKYFKNIKLNFNSEIYRLN
ncbi:MAG: class I SAM-dependent methyltransferase [Candidatus Helarchaeota archaeon]